MILALALGCGSDAELVGVEPDRTPTEELPQVYQGGWEAATDCPARLAETDDYGNDEGDTPPDFALLDQYGERLHLHDFCDRVVLLVWAGFT